MNQFLSMIINAMLLYILDSIIDSRTDKLYVLLLSSPCFVPINHPDIPDSLEISEKTLKILHVSTDVNKFREALTMFPCKITVGKSQGGTTRCSI